MALFARIIATLWLLMQLVACLPTSPELLRIPRYVWDTDVTKRDVSEADQAAADKSVKPTDHEKFVWASHNGKPGDKAVVVSMVAWSKQDERILDMDKFSFAIKSAHCTEDDMSLTFVNPLIYYAAKVAWEWVNFNDLRSFILVASSDKCGHDKSHDPWVVKGVKFNDKEQRVEMHATKSSWKKVMNTFELDFGEVVLGKGDHWDRSMMPERRDIIPDLDKKFRLDIGATLPEQIFLWEINKGVLHGNVTANCKECGTQGALVFAGHVEASLHWTGVKVDKFEISVKPDGVALHMGLSLEFLGHFDFRKVGKPSKEVNLLEIPVSGWKIPGVFEFGPHIDLNAGYEIAYISGHAEASTGITAKIPDSAIAKLDLLSKDKVQISRWKPEIETQPLEVEVMLDAQASIYTEIALSVSLTVLGDNGFGVDIALKIPEVTVTVAGGVDTAGFCPDKPKDPFGVEIDAMVGADLSLEGWKEVEGDKDKLFEVDIFNKPDIYTFPTVCFSFGDISEGYCLPEEAPQGGDDVDEPDVVERSVDDGDADDIVERSNELAARSHKGKKYKLGCDPDKIVRAPPYPAPSELTKYTGTPPIPIIVPDVPCADAEEDCKPNTGITVTNTTDRDMTAVIDNTFKKKNEPESQMRWNSEHIYEANWVRDFMDHVEDKMSGAPKNNCRQNVLDFWKDYNDLTTYPVPDGAKRKPSYITAMAQQLGSMYTQDRMALVQMRINKLKFNMFNPSTDELVGGDRKKTLNNAGRWSCELARISATCKYFAHEEVQKGLKRTIQGVEAVLDAADKDSRISVSGFSYKDTHKNWYNELYKNATTKARGRLEDYATMVMEKYAAEFKKLDDDVQEQIEKLKTSASFREEVCPMAERKGW